jgi:hypothetical protein
VQLYEIFIMSRSRRKSIPYYVVLVCLTLIGVSTLFGLLWQPSFEYGYISMRFYSGHLHFSLWTFLPALIFITLFIYYTFRVIKKYYSTREFVLAELAGLGFIIFLSLLRPAYTSRSTAGFADGNALHLFSQMLLFSRVLVGVVMLLLLFRWRRYRLAVKG